MWEKVRTEQYERIALKHVPYVKEMTSASSMHEAGHSKPALWDNPEGWGGGRWEGGSGWGDTCASVADSC